MTTVSGKIASLEKRLAVTLIHRTTRKLSITGPGKSYFRHCVRALEEVKAAERELWTTKAEPEGLLRLTAPPDIGHILLPPIIRAYLKAHPKVQMELILTNRMVDLVGEGVDLAIRAGNLTDSSLVTRKFRDSEMTIWASSSYEKKNGIPRQPKELADHSFIGFSFIENTLKLINNRAIINISVKPRFIVDDMEAVRVFVMGGDGIGILPRVLCETEAAQGKIIKVLPEWNLDTGPGHLSLVYPPQRYMPPKIQAFIELATQVR